MTKIDNKNLEKLIKLSAKILKVPEKQLNLKSSPNSVDNWDSLSHLELISVTEKEFKVNISPEESVEINKIEDILKIISK